MTTTPCNYSSKEMRCPVFKNLIMISFNFPRMKMIVLFFILCVSAVSASAQLKTTARCPDFEIDILDGKVNGIKPDVTTERIKLLLPCFTSTAGEGDTAKCGSNVFYKDRDIFFYTARDYVQVGPNFKGKMSLPIMGADRKNLFSWLGHPKLKDVTWEAYQTNYGCLVLHFDAKGKVNLLQFASVGTEGLNLCE